MKPVVLFPALLLASHVSARPVLASWSRIKREVPQEHSHEQFLTTVRTSLNLDNPAGIVDPIFALLGDAAAAQGQGSITDVECLQQATADQAFTNAKAAGDVNGQVAALIYRTLERNTGSVGAQSNPCTSIQAVNPEIAALSQHQDPASDGAAATNKGIALALAVQIAAVGGDPTDAIKSGTFAPGTIGDPTAAGHTCDDQNDPVGCIFTQNLLVPDVTDDEIASAVAAGGAGASVATASAVAASSASTMAAMSMSIMATAPTTATTVAAASPTAAVQASSSADNLQSFTGDLGAAADSITFSGNADRPFLVNGDTFVNFAAAAQRTCDIQFNACADQANSGAGFSVSDCQTQEDQCDAAQQSATVTTFSATAAATTSQAVAPVASATQAVSQAAASTNASAPATAATSPAPAAASTSPAGALDFGTCPSANPTILFGPGFDGRTEDAFELQDQTDFPHGSADGIGVLTAFVCQQLQDKCKASAAAASGQAAADAWNGAFGV